MPITLRVEGPESSHVLSFDSYATVVVGRAETAQICVRDDAYFSRKHCRLEIAPPQAKVVDLDSSNGTLVNGERVTDRELVHGDVISGGSTTIRVEIVPDGAATLLFEPIDVTEDTDPNATESFDVAGQNHTRIGPYLITEEIGRGGMGVVYLGHHMKTQEPAAIKLVIPNQTVNEKQVRLFMREVNILSRLQHDRIVPVRDVGEDNGHLYVAMQYVEHKPYREWTHGMSDAKRLRFACGIAVQALSALQYSHDMGVVHRDIKPANLLLASEAKRLAVYVADFGLAKNFENAGFSGLTQQGEVRGTLAFMPPEQLADARFVEPVSDLYSVGATLYHLLTDRYPYDFPDATDPVAVIINRDSVPIQLRDPSIPTELAAVIARALEKRPEKRFRTAAEMEAALRPFLRKDKRA